MTSSRRGSRATYRSIDCCVDNRRRRTSERWCSVIAKFTRSRGLAASVVEEGASLLLLLLLGVGGRRRGGGGRRGTSGGGGEEARTNLPRGRGARGRTTLRSSAGTMTFKDSSPRERGVGRVSSEWIFGKVYSRHLLVRTRLPSLVLRTDDKCEDVFFYLNGQQFRHSPPLLHIGRVSIYA